jgi:PAS domain-containing protein
VHAGESRRSVAHAAERLQEGALTLGQDGTVLYADTFLGRLLGEPLSEIIGRPFTSWVAPSFRSLCRPLLEHALLAPIKQTLRLETRQGTIPVQLTLSPLSAGEGGTCCAVVFDLRERNAHAQAQLISELLDVSRIVAGKLHLSASIRTGATGRARRYGAECRGCPGEARGRPLRCAAERSGPAGPAEVARSITQLLERPAP